MILLLTQLIGLSMGLSWSTATTHNTIGFKVKIAAQTFDVGNHGALYLTKVNPGKVYTMQIVSYAANGIEFPHATSILTQPPKPLTLKLSEIGLLRVDCYEGGFFEIQQSDDLFTWSTLRIFTATSDAYSIQVDQGSPMKFYRVKQVSEATMQGSYLPPWEVPLMVNKLSKQGLTVQDINHYEPQERSVDDAHMSIARVDETEKNTHMSRWQKLRHFLRYREGMHWDTSERFKK